VASRVIHVGADICHRLPVLESAGYQVDTCDSVRELDDALAGEEQLEAVLISEGLGGGHQDAVSLARSRSSAPIVLFRETQRSVTESTFDLVVPNLVPPETWLADIAALIARCQTLRTNSQTLRQESAKLQRESAIARAKSNGERQRARQEYSRKITPPDGLVSGPGPDGKK
jgi:hypothetical protein